MIVQTIDISLSKGRAPELLAHLGESNRQIEMIPDVTLPETAGAEINIVKPDGTFAIQAAVITDGHIIVTLPDQACTVKGLSHYILKITDTGTVIYSAYGNILVDDHLITDELIESVAEVNGYVFPDDFALKSDIPVNPIDDSIIALDKTWSSSKINAAISSINPLHEYSYTSHKVGTYTDGTNEYDVYEICYDSPANDHKVNLNDFFGRRPVFAWVESAAPIPYMNGGQGRWTIASPTSGCFYCYFQYYNDRIDFWSGGLSISGGGHCIYTLRAVMERSTT